MKIYPVANCGDAACLEARFGTAARMGAPAVHLDVSDGVFSPVNIGGTPEELEKLHAEFPGLDIHAHLMVARPEEVLGAWVRAGARRIIIHAEAVSDWSEVKGAIAGRAEIFIGVKKETPVDILKTYAEDETVKGVHILAVPIGFSGGAQDPETSNRIKEIKEKWPRLKVSVDGGINLETAQAVKEAGADEVVSSTYIFGSPDPQAAYAALAAL